VSGLNPGGRTCGAPLACIIENTNTRSQDYDELARKPRPGHADWVAQEKWHGEQDVAGGGHFSGRLTAPVCAAGAICLQMLEERGVFVSAHLTSVEGVVDERFDALATDEAARRHLAEQMRTLSEKGRFPVIDEGAGKGMRAAIESARKDADSVGGMIECVACGMPAGVGDPMFDGIENLLARAAFGIPAVKGMEFGRGFDCAAMRGSKHNDPYRMRDGRVVPESNNAGGILGGITTGQPILFQVAVKPTSSIGSEQETVDLTKGTDAKLIVHGRHDPCIAPRAVPVVEAICGIVLLDALITYPPMP
jgi:chorismate synthase